MSRRLGREHDNGLERRLRAALFAIDFECDSTLHQAKAGDSAASKAAGRGETVAEAKRLHK